MSLRVVVVGGGISGLACAWYLSSGAAAGGVSLDCTVLEASSRWGGKLSSERVVAPDGGTFVVEAGPDSFLARKPWGLALARELGLAETFIPTGRYRHSVHVLRRGRPVAMPPGMHLVVPTKLGPFLRSPLLSWPGRLRMAAERWVPPRRDAGDESLANFVQRRFGQEALVALAEPIMAGIHSADPNRESMRAGFPRLLEMEAQYGSLLRAVRANAPRTNAARANAARTEAARAKAARTEAAHRHPQAEESPSTAFVSLEGGMASLVQRLTERLAALPGVHLRSGAAVDGLVRRSSAEGGAWGLRLQTGELLQADAVVLSAPAAVAARLLGEAAPQAVGELSQLRTVGTGTLSLAYPAEDVARPLPGYGLVIPADEGRRLNALTVSSAKFAGRAPQGTVLLRAFFGGARTPELMARDDDSVVAAVRDELKTLLGVAAPPLFHRIHRWVDGSPQYDVGHVERMARLEAALPPGVWVAGAPYRGVGIPDCVRQAQQTAAAVLAAAAPFGKG